MEDSQDERTKRVTLLKQIEESVSGLGIELREGRLSDEYYPTVLRALTEYRESIRGERLIDRELAGALHYLDITFLGALEYTGFETEKRRLLGQVHQRFVPIMQDIFSPNSDALME